MSIDDSLVDLRIVRESAGSFLKNPKILSSLFSGTEMMYVPETEEKKLCEFL